MSDFELTSSSRTDLKLAQFSILTCLAWRHLARLCMFAENTATQTPWDWGWQGRLPRAAHFTGSQLMKELGVLRV